MWFNGDTNGANFMAEYIMGQFRSDYRHSVATSYALLTGNQNTVGLQDPLNPGNVYFGTQGWLSYLNQFSNIYPYTPNTLTLADDDNIGRIMEQNIWGKYEMRMMGYDLDVEVENYLVNFLAPTQTSPAVIDEVANEFFSGDNYEDGKNIAMTIGFNYLKKGRYCHMLYPMRMLNDPKGMGAFNATNAYAGQSLGMLVSMSTKKTSFDGVSSQTPCMGYMYKEFNGYSRLAEKWSVGGGRQRTNLQDKDSMFWRSEIGGLFTAGEQAIYMHP